MDSVSILKRRRGQLLPSKSDETKLKPTAATGGTTTAKGSMATCGTMMATGGSTAMSSTTTRQNEGDGRHDNTAVSPYYSKFRLRIRNEPAAAHYGANVGLKNSNVNCYSNAIFQCIASCICYSGFSPSEKHPPFQLNHAFAYLMSSFHGWK